MRTLAAGVLFHVYGPIINTRINLHRHLYLRFGYATNLDTFEDHNAQHDDETDTNNYGERKEVGVDIKGRIVRDANNEPI